MIEAMTRALAQGGKVEIRGFGNFTVRQREARKARNPRTGEMLEVPAKRVPHFKPGKSLRRWWRVVKSCCLCITYGKLTCHEKDVREVGLF